MTYKEILSAFGIDERELAITWGYGGQDPLQTMRSSTPHRSGRVQAVVELIVARLIEASPKLSAQEVSRRLADTPYLLELCERNGVDTTTFRKLTLYIEQGVNPKDPDDAQVIEAERIEWERILRAAKLIE